MSESNLNADGGGLQAGEQLAGVATLADAAAVGSAARSGQSTRGLRRRFNATRLAAPSDDGLRPFRVY